MDIIVQSAKLRKLILQQIEDRNLSYPQVVAMAKADGIAIAKSNLSNYKKGNRVGSLSQKALIYLAMKLDIYLNFSVHIATEAEQEKLQHKLKNFLEYEQTKNSKSKCDAKTGKVEAQ